MPKHKISSNCQLKLQQTFFCRFNWLCNLSLFILNITRFHVGLLCCLAFILMQNCSHIGHLKNILVVPYLTAFLKLYCVALWCTMLPPVYYWFGAELFYCCALFVFVRLFCSFCLYWRLWSFRYYCMRWSHFLCEQSLIILGPFDHSANI